MIFAAATQRGRWPILAILSVLASPLVAENASANTAGRSEICVGTFDLSNRFSSLVATYEDGPSNPGGFGMGDLETRGNTNFTFDAMEGWQYCRRAIRSPPISTTASVSARIRNAFSPTWREPWMIRSSWTTTRTLKTDVC